MEQSKKLKEVTEYAHLELKLRGETVHIRLGNDYGLKKIDGIVTATLTTNREIENVLDHVSKNEEHEGAAVLITAVATEYKVAMGWKLQMISNGTSINIKDEQGQDLKINIITGNKKTKVSKKEMTVFVKKHEEGVKIVRFIWEEAKNLCLHEFPREKILAKAISLRGGKDELDNGIVHESNGNDQD